MAYDLEKGNNRGGYQAGFGGGGGYGNSGRPAGGGGGAGFAGDVEDPLVSSIKENIKQMSQNVGNITKSVGLLGTARDGQDLRDRLSSTIETTKQLAKDTTSQLKQLSLQTGGTPEQRNSNKMLHQKLTKDFTAWLTKFQEVSKLSAQKERTLPPPPPPNNKQGRQPDTFPQARGDYDDYHAESEKQGLLDSSRKREQLLQIENEREFNDTMIVDRENDIKQIEQAVSDVNEIFTDLANLVHEQGFMIDNIESNIESTAVQTQQGVQELRKASQHQKSARSKLCILAIIISVIAAVLTVILVLTLKK